MEELLLFESLHVLRRNLGEVGSSLALVQQLEAEHGVLIALDNDGVRLALDAGPSVGRELVAQHLGQAGRVVDELLPAHAAVHDVLLEHGVSPAFLHGREAWIELLGAAAHVFPEAPDVEAHHLLDLLFAGRLVHLAPGGRVMVVCQMHGVGHHGELIAVRVEVALPRLVAVHQRPVVMATLRDVGDEAKVAHLLVVEGRIVPRLANCLGRVGARVAKGCGQGQYVAAREGHGVFLE